MDAGERGRDGLSQEEKAHRSFGNGLCLEQQFKAGLQGLKDANLNGEESSRRKVVGEELESMWKAQNAGLEVFCFVF